MIPYSLLKKETVESLKSPFSKVVSLQFRSYNFFLFIRSFTSKLFSLNFIKVALNFSYLDSNFYSNSKNLSDA